MSDTMTIVGTPTGFEPAGYGGGLSDPSMPNTGISSGQLHLQVTLPYYQSPQLCQSAMAWLAKYVKDHGANDPLTIQVVANNIRCFVNADTNLVHNRRLTVYDAYHSINPHPSKYDYHSMSLYQMSGNVVTPAAAFGHYLWGEGQERYVNLPDVGLKVAPTQIEPLMAMVNSGVVGNIPFAADFIRDTFVDGIIPGSYLGHIKLRTEGTLSIQNGGAWSYNGVIRAYNDSFDFNLGNFRGPIAESMTYLGSLFSGTAYNIALPGQIEISGSGQR
ncbi:lipid II-degrading bacteriocin [Serratia sp. CY85251]|uniref:lipid II-degrading bacteriocin n=1 Tax=Serratia sp. CY85251 TaxID=3383696 RepID=UPI003FA02BEE